jgi:hypothetical protein
MENGKIKSITVSKGYRLRPSTHQMISMLKAILNNSQDEVISRAIGNLYAEIKSGNTSAANTEN